MSIELRARVMKLDQTPDEHPPGTPWVADAWAIETRGDDRAPEVLSTRSLYAASHPEAVQAAHVLLSNIDDDLMAGVHASRAQRRTAADELGFPSIRRKAM